MYIKKVLWAVALMGVLAIGYVSYSIYNAIFTPNTAFKEDKVVVFIPSNATFLDVNIIVGPLLLDSDSFTALAKRKGYVNAIRAGKFILEKGMNNNDIINRLRSGRMEVKVSFNNQENLEKLAGRIAVQIESDSISILSAIKDPAFYLENGFKEEEMLSMFLPNSYQFYWNTTGDGFRDKMLKEYHRFWNSENIEKAKKIGLSPQEVSTLASIVHKETAKVEERKRVAGVYLNRLKKGMKLQADPTVIYAIKKHTGNFDTIIKRVLYRDLELASPYNTYKQTGLPPGPITMPDISAIEGVLNAEKHNYYYFVADISNFGYHKFAKTLAQHNRNKQQYIQWLRLNKINR